MKGTIVGSTHVLNNGYLNFVTYESNNKSIEGLSVCTLFTKEYRAIGDPVEVYSIRTTNGYKFYERKKG